MKLTQRLLSLLALLFLVSFAEDNNAYNVIKITAPSIEKLHQKIHQIQQETIKK